MRFPIEAFTSDLLVLFFALPAFAQPGSASIEPAAGTWKTWVLTSGNQFRLPPPPDATATRVELDDLRELANLRDLEIMRRVQFWDAGSPLYRWQEITFAEGVRRTTNNIIVSRAAGLVAIAIYDAMVAAWDSKYAYNRPHPAQIDSTFVAALADPASPSYPSEHAVAAGAAESVLKYVFPDLARRWTDLAEEAARSRLLAGVHFPSDVAQGLELDARSATRLWRGRRATGSTRAA